MYCKKCGSQLPNGALFCQKCGTKVDMEEKSRPTENTQSNSETGPKPTSMWTCPNCNRVNPSSHTACAVCGTKYGSTAKPASANSGKWTCSNCKHQNYSHDSRCTVCGMDKSSSINDRATSLENKSAYFGCAVNAWFIFCIISNIVAIISMIFMDVNKDMRGIMYLSILVSAAVAAGYVGLMAKQQKRYVYLIILAALINAGIACFGLEWDVKSALMCFVNPIITMAILVLGKFWNDMDA